MINAKHQQWQTLAIDDCMDAIIDYRGKSPTKTTFGVPLVTAKIVKNGRIETPNEFIAEADFDAWMRRGMPQSGDVVMTTEAPLGEIAQLDGRRVALAQRLITLRGKGGLLDNTFLKFALQSAFVQDQLRSRATGTTVIGIRQSELRQVHVPVPPIDEQERIANILGSLDDKSELNRRMNETLESIVRRLFRSWFVDFVPVHAKAAVRRKHPTWPNDRVSREALPTLDPKVAELFSDSFEESTLEQIPIGWTSGTIGDVAENPRRSIKRDEIDSATPYIALEHMPRRSITLPEWANADGVESGKSKFRRGEILFGKLRPYFHKVGIAPVDGVCSTDVLVIVPKNENWFGFALGHISSDDLIAHTNAASTGTKMPRTNWGDIARYSIVIPPDALAAEYSRQLQPLLARLTLNAKESRELAMARNRLLPELLSGHIPT